MWDTISQIAIFVLGASAIILVAKKNKWGFVVGIFSQPFWFITSFVNQQWGGIFCKYSFHHVLVTWNIRMVFQR